MPLSAGHTGPLSHLLSFTWLPSPARMLPTALLSTQGDPCHSSVFSSSLSPSLDQCMQGGVHVSMLSHVQLFATPSTVEEHSADCPDHQWVLLSEPFYIRSKPLACTLPSLYSACLCLKLVAHKFMISKHQVLSPRDTPPPLQKPTRGPFLSCSTISSSSCSHLNCLPFKALASFRNLTMFLGLKSQTLFQRKSSLTPLFALSPASSPSNSLIVPLKYFWVMPICP